MNHSLWFVSYDGTHTDWIEVFRASGKEKAKNEHGIMRINIDEWFDEFNLCMTFICHKNYDDDVSSVFIDVIKKIVNWVFISVIIC